MQENTENYSHEGIVPSRKKCIIPDMSVTKREISRLMGRNLARIRTLRNMSQQDLADKIGSTPSYVSQMERGHTSLSIDMLSRLCTALEVDMQEFTRPEHGGGKTGKELTDFEREFIRLMSQMPEDYQDAAARKLHSDFLFFLKTRTKKD